MKKNLLLTLTLIMSIGLYAQEKIGVKWEEGNLQQALDKAKTNKEEPNLVFLDCYTVWCGPCKWMTKEVFPTKEAGKFFNKNFVNIKIDMEKGEGIALKDKYGVSAFPTFLILDANGNEIGRVIGGGKLETFIPKVEKAMDPANSVDAMLVKYRESKKIEDAYSYLEGLKKNYMSNKIDMFFAEFYDQLGYSLYRPEMWQYINDAIPSSNGFFYNKIIGDMFSASKDFGKDKIELAISRTTTGKLRGYIIGKLELTKEEIHKYIQILSFINSDDNMTSFICKTASAIAANDMEEVGKQLNASKLFYDFDGSDRGVIERMFTMIKGVPEMAFARYYQEITRLLNNSLEAAKKEDTKYDHIEVPEDKKKGIRAVRMM